ncbi:hypothetical protein Ciccas_005097 [Cichlidogyrus casuarinus]|uniref:Uncharacterized protein n=1 Tax=Cichlidogyrus casuarinus TaxID=1844966 RepID=A0ABD2Q9M4_9PLAT
MLLVNLLIWAALVSQGEQLCQNQPSILLHLNVSSVLLTQNEQLVMENFRRLGPCCTPVAWKSQFHVIEMRQGRNSSLHLAQIHINQTSSMQVIGSRVRYSGSCGDTLPNVDFCPNLTVECLTPPHLGRPRCVGESTGYRLREMIYIKRKFTREIWFQDILRPSDQDDGEYQLIVGQYANPRINCDLLIVEQSNFMPQANTLRIGFRRDFFENVPFIIC